VIFFASVEHISVYDFYASAVHRWAEAVLRFLTVRPFVYASASSWWHSPTGLSLTSSYQWL